MRNPWLIVLTCVAIFAAAFFLDKAPGPVRAFAGKVQIDKIFHASAGYALTAFGITFLGLRSPAMLFLWVLAVGAGWELMQYLADRSGFELHGEPTGVNSYEFYADLAMDMAGALIYWALHLAPLEVSLD